MFSVTKGKMRGVNLILSVIVIFGLLFALANAAPVIPDDDNSNNDDGTSIQTFELDNGAGAAASPNFIFSPVVAAVTDNVVDTIGGGGVLAKPNSSPQVWRLGTMDDHDHDPHHPTPTTTTTTSSQLHRHPDFESPLGHHHHNGTHDSATDQLHHQFDRRHSFALNCQDDRSYTNACTRKGYSCNSLGRVITRGRDSWCDSKCRCVNLSPKSCLNQLAVYIDCYLKGENIMGVDGTVIGNIYTAEDLGNDTLVLH